MSPRVVVIGGGYTGITFAQELQRQDPNVHLTVIEKRSYFFHAVGSLRAMVDPKFGEKLFIPLDNALKKSDNVCILEAEARKIEKDQIVVEMLKQGKEVGEIKTIPFDYLVVATGSSYPGPIKPINGDDSKASVEASFKDCADRVEKADSIAIIGAGAVGCELAGEIMHLYPGKKVTVIDSNSEVIAKQNVTAKFRTCVMGAMKSMGIEFLLGERLEERMTSHHFSRKVLKTQSGTEIESDLQFVCAGMIPNSTLVQKMDESLLENGYVKVKKNMQLDSEKHENIFVIGDASNHPTPKMAYWGGEQATHLSKNLVKKMKCKTPIADFETPQTEVIVLPLGPQNGVSQLPYFGGIVMGSFVTRIAKSYDLFTTRFWAQLGAKILN